MAEGLHVQLQLFSGLVMIFRIDINSTYNVSESHLNERFVIFRALSFL